jgi:hypothetical protein
MKLHTRIHLVPNLGEKVATLPLSHMSLWRTKGKIYFNVQYLKCKLPSGH